MVPHPPPPGAGPGSFPIGIEGHLDDLGVLGPENGKEAEDSANDAHPGRMMHVFQKEVDEQGVGYDHDPSIIGERHEDGARLC